MEQIVSDSMNRQRMYAVLLGIFAGVAVAMAAIGIYGVVAYSAAQRTREIGIRVALGAQRGNLLKLILGQGLTLAGAGLAAGLAAAFALTRFGASFLYEIEPADAMTYLLVSVILVIVALVACYVPARRALRINPLEALREE